MEIFLGGGQKISMVEFYFFYYFYPLAWTFIQFRMVFLRFWSDYTNFDHEKKRGGGVFFFLWLKT